LKLSSNNNYYGGGL